MTRPVLTGGRTPLRPRSPAVWIALVWLPVLVCLLVITRESTDAFSSAHTSGWIRHLAEWFAGPIPQDRWEQVHHDIRKTGHFIGYGLVGLSWLRAWLLTWLMRLRFRAARVWRAYGVAMALFCTMLTASCDEVHQSFLPSRTGLVSDIWLDTSGAAVLITLISATWLWRSRAAELPSVSGRGADGFAQD